MPLLRQSLEPAASRAQDIPFEILSTPLTSVLTCLLAPAPTDSDGVQHFSPSPIMQGQPIKSVWPDAK